MAREPHLDQSTVERLADMSGAVSVVPLQESTEGGSEFGTALSGVSRLSGVKRSLADVDGSADRQITLHTPDADCRNPNHVDGIFYCCDHCIWWEQEQHAWLCYSGMD